MKLLPFFIIPTTIAILYYLMPFYGKFVVGRIFSILLTLFLLGGNFYLTYAMYAHDAVNEAHQAVIAEERRTADRACELIRENGGIPVAGALELLNNDPMTQGPKLFKQHCASCHPFVGGTELDIPADEISAPNLFGFGTRQWVAGWLEPKKVGGPDYFGHTAFKRGDMVEFVKESFEDLEEEDIEDRTAMVMALSGQAALPCQAELDKKDAERIEGGQELLADCADCHKFGEDGELGTAPELTGYASTKWTTEIVSNPAAKRFYGDNNDRMPAYAEFDDESKNIMTNHQIEMLVEWLRSCPAPKAEAKAAAADEKKDDAKAEEKKADSEEADSDEE